MSTAIWLTKSVSREAVRVSATTVGVDAVGGAGGVATGGREGEVGDEPQAIDTARITTPNASLLIMNRVNSRKGRMTRRVTTSAYRWPLSGEPAR